MQIATQDKWVLNLITHKRFTRGGGGGAAGRDKHPVRA
jgi:hypothetical protein